MKALPAVIVPHGDAAGGTGAQGTKDPLDRHPTRLDGSEAVAALGNRPAR